MESLKFTQLLRMSLLILGIMSVTINMFVLVLVYRMRHELIKLSHKLVAIISIVDLLSGLNTVISFMVMEKIGIDASFKSQLYCPVFGFIANMTIILSGILMAGLAVERYVLVCHEKLLSSRTTFLCASLIMSLILIPSLVVSFQNELSHDPLNAYCVVTGDYGWGNFTNKLTTPMYILPLSVLSYCYLSILRRVRSGLSLAYSTSSPSLDKQYDIKVARRMVAIKSLVFIFLYSACFLPKFITLAWSYTESHHEKSSIPIIMNILAPLGINFLNCVNPILILVLHTQYKQSAQDIFLKSYQRHSTANSSPHGGNPHLILP